MEYLGNNPLPELEQVESPDRAVRHVIASVLKESPALRTMAELVRDDPPLFETVADYMARVEDFRATYDRPGRSVAPWFAAVAQGNPDLLDTALDSHFDLKSEAFKAKLDSEVASSGYSYVPLLVVGSGPQAQIFVSELAQAKPELVPSTAVIDKSTSVGGTFRNIDGMNFRLNSRTRPQTDERPVPGTTSNLNTLAPGVVTLPDMATEVYPAADTLGRAIRINHALNGNQVGLGLELVAVAPDTSPESTQLPGKVSVVVRDAEGIEFTIRTDSLVATSGVGEPKLSRFTTETRDLIKELQKKRDAGEQTPVMSYADFYKWMSEKRFPLEGIKRVAVIGAGDSGRTAVGTLLGYEPRPDGSVIQVDTVEKLDWYGQTSNNDRAFIERTRLRYGQLALELPRRQNNLRASRVESFEVKPANLSLVDDGKVRVSDTGNVYDLVVIATGFENNGQKWLEDKLKQPLLVDSERVQEALDSENPISLDSGDIVVFPVGYNIAELHILRKQSSRFVPDVTQYTVSITTQDGKTSIGTLLQGSNPDNGEVYSELADYCALDNFVSEQQSNLRVLAEVEGVTQEAEVQQTLDFLNMSKSQKIEFLGKKPFFFPGGSCRNLSSITCYQVDDIDDSAIYLERYAFNFEDQIFIRLGGTRIDYRGFGEALRQSNDLGLLVSNPALNSLLLNGTGKNAETFRGPELIDRIDELTDQNAVLLFDNPNERINLVTLYRNKSGEIKFAFYDGVEDTYESAVSFDEDRLRDRLAIAANVTVINLNQPRGLEVLAKSDNYRSFVGTEFTNLSDAEKMAQLRPGTIILGGGSKNSTYIVVSTGQDAQTVQLKRIAISTAPDRTISETGNILDSGATPLSQVTSIIGGQSGALINAPAILAPSNKNSVYADSQILNLPQAEILNRLEEFFELGAILVSSRSEGFYKTVIPIKKADGSFEAAVIRNNGYIGLDAVTIGVIRDLDSQLDLDRVIIPPRSNRKRAKLKYTPTTKPTIITVTGQDNLPIAKQVDQAPIYLVGPAAGLKVMDEVTQLIPDIPENSVGIFTSQPRVVELAGKLAIANRRAKARTTQEEQYCDVEDLAGGDPATVTVENLQGNVAPAAKRLDPRTLLKLGFGITSRHRGLYSDPVSEISTVGKLQKISMSVKLDPKDPHKMVVSTMSGKNNEIVVGDEAYLYEVATNPLINHAFATLLAQRGTNGIKVVLPFDDRGLRLDTMEVEVKRKAKLRPNLPAL